MTRCTCCKSKIAKIMMIECNYCNNTYCISCRTPEIHKCTIDKKMLRSTEPQYENAKFNKVLKI